MKSRVQVTKSYTNNNYIKVPDELRVSQCFDFGQHFPGFWAKPKNRCLSIKSGSSKVKQYQALRTGLFPPRMDINGNGMANNENAALPDHCRIVDIGAGIVERVPADSGNP